MIDYVVETYRTPNRIVGYLASLQEEYDEIRADAYYMMLTSDMDGYRDYLDYLMVLRDEIERAEYYLAMGA